ncbi:hypothetical protein DFR48_101391 [Ciceribacter lividus]|uniref:Uncharacterized protein n=1 Tax=Ciceribacter lividus TaxID=1197950 RepID=A0A6I7HU08_9HYPH|nr:hypothetical protein [Ciceribacter lividus]RCW28379.1 hypothetical protein DFR48_101391 [Ciceribacter lividus]
MYGRMEQPASKSPRIALWAALFGAGAAATGAVFAGWLNYGSAIVLAYMENGLSSCF